MDSEGARQGRGGVEKGTQDAGRKVGVLKNRTLKRNVAESLIAREASGEGNEEGSERSWSETGLEASVDIGRR